MATKVTTEGRGTTFNLDEMRVVLSDSIRDIRESEASAANVNAISNAVGKILSSVKLQIEYYRMIGKTPDIPMLTTREKEAA
jgi:hypothetical protein